MICAKIKTTSAARKNDLPGARIVSPVRIGAPRLSRCSQGRWHAHCIESAATEFLFLPDPECHDEYGSRIRHGLDSLV